jgi:hypothetical protein
MSRTCQVHLVSRLRIDSDSITSSCFTAHCSRKGSISNGELASWYTSATYPRQLLQVHSKLAVIAFRSLEQQPRCKLDVPGCLLPVCMIDPCTADRALVCACLSFYHRKGARVGYRCKLTTCFNKASCYDTSHAIRCRIAEHNAQALGISQLQWNSVNGRLL